MNPERGIPASRKRDMARNVITTCKIPAFLPQTEGLLILARTLILPHTSVHLPSPIPFAGCTSGHNMFFPSELRLHFLLLLCKRYAHLIYSFSDLL